MSLPLRPGRRRSRRKIRARAGEAKPRKTSGRSAGSITRKLRDILQPVGPPSFCISFSDSLIIPARWADKNIHLIMEGVFHESVILVDEAAVAVHGDGWTPIEVDMTDALAGETSFVLGVDARVPDDRTGGRFSKSLAAKQDWYGVQAGIWKAARLV